MKRWLRVWILAAVPAVAWGQASTGLPAPSTNGISGVPVPTLATGYLYYNSGTNSFVFQSPSGSGSVNSCASAYAVAYYAGGGTAVSCSAAFSGLGYFSTGSAPVAATGAEIVSVIGSNAVADATSATSFTGSLSGDVTGTQSATTVSKINGGAVPASASVLSSNASSQLTAATNITTTTSSTLGGNANLFNNAAAATNVVEIQAGTSAAQTEQLQWQNYSGTPEWDNTVDTSYTYRIQDVAHSSLDRITIYQGGGNTNINAGSGAYAVCLNCAASSGTSGMLVQNGASSPSTVLTVTGSGNTTATGFVSGKFLMGTGTMTFAAGAAAGSSPSIACATSHVCDGVSGTVALTTGTSPTTGTLATISFPNTHSNYANCIVTTASATAVLTTNTWTESTTAITISANASLTASTAYTVKYWCGGN